MGSAAAETAESHKVDVGLVIWNDIQYEPAVALLLLFTGHFMCLLQPSVFLQLHNQVKKNEPNRQA